MGDPKKQRKKFFKPSHPWQKQRLDEESALVEEYALKNKKEIWKMQSRLKHYTSQAKELVKIKTKQMEQERALLLNSLKRLGIIKENATLDDVLGLGLRDVMERRLQTRVARKGLAKTMKQSRQFIVHKHVMVSGQVVSVPSYLVPLAEDDTITFVAVSTLNNPDHPERIVQKSKKKKTKDAPERKTERKPERKREKPVQKAGKKHEKDVKKDENK
jgi:small subunit ribosomal protein S4